MSTILDKIKSNIMMVNSIYSLSAKAVTMIFFSYLTFYALEV